MKWWWQRVVGWGRGVLEYLYVFYRYRVTCFFRYALTVCARDDDDGRRGNNITWKEKKNFFFKINNSKVHVGVYRYSVTLTADDLPVRWQRGVASGGRARGKNTRKLVWKVEKEEEERFFYYRIFYYAITYIMYMEVYIIIWIYENHFSSAAAIDYCCCCCCYYYFISLTLFLFLSWCLLFARYETREFFTIIIIDRQTIKYTNRMPLYIVDRV